MTHPQSDRSPRYPEKVRKALRTLLGETGIDPATLSERRSVVDGITRVDKELMGETRSVESDDREVAKFALQEFLVEDELLNALMQLPECDRRRRLREEVRKRSRKPCPAGCEEGRFRLMDGWVRCEACHGQGWVV